jgi:hypothetical protein
MQLDCNDLSFTAVESTVNNGRERRGYQNLSSKNSLSQQNVRTTVLKPKRTFGSKDRFFVNLNLVGTLMGKKVSTLHHTRLLQLTILEPLLAKTTHV